MGTFAKNLPLITKTLGGGAVIWGVFFIRRKGLSFVLMAAHMRSHSWQPGVAGHLTIRLNAMLEAEELPARVSDLHAALPASGGRVDCRLGTWEFGDRSLGLALASYVFNGTYRVRAPKYSGISRSQNTVPTYNHHGFGSNFGSNDGHLLC